MCVRVNEGVLDVSTRKCRDKWIIMHTRMWEDVFVLYVFLSTSSHSVVFVCFCAFRPSPFVGFYILNMYG